MQMQTECKDRFALAGLQQRRSELESGQWIILAIIAVVVVAVVCVGGTLLTCAQCNSHANSTCAARGVAVCTYSCSSTCGAGVSCNFTCCSPPAPAPAPVQNPTPVNPPASGPSTLPRNG